MTSAPAALASGLITAGLTALGGTTGAEALLARQGATSAALKGFWSNMAGQVPKNTLKEIPEEWFDQVASTLIQATAKGEDPRIALGQLLAESPDFIANVALMGGLGGVKEAWSQRHE